MRSALRGRNRLNREKPDGHRLLGINPYLETLLSFMLLVYFFYTYISLIFIGRYRLCISASMKSRDTIFAHGWDTCILQVSEYYPGGM